jgi:phosphoesterase RecJ-like protein
MSFRSQGDIAVNEMASNHFSGGGHKNAAGGTSDRDIDTTVQALLDILPKYKSTLQDD